MVDWEEKIAAEFEVLGSTLVALGTTLARPRLEQTEWMAAAGFLHNVYSGIENVLKLALRSREIPIPEISSRSHRDLLDLAVRQGVLSERVKESLDEYRAFRQFFVHGYGVRLDPSQLETLTSGVAEICRHVRAEVETFLGRASK